MAKGKQQELTIEEKLGQALVPEDEQPYEVPSNWVWIKLLEAFDNLTSSNKKLPQKSYFQDGNYAVVDQGKDLIGGFTYEDNLLFNGELPIILFGDHTRIVKYIDFPFVQGADGVKILKPRSYYDARFFYYLMQNIYIPDLGYRRHFPLFPTLSCVLPPLAEQQRIVDRIERLFGKLDNAKELAQNALDSVETRKAAILHKAFSGELTDQWREKNGLGMDSWENKVFGKCTSIMQNGISKRKGTIGSEIVVLRLANIKDNSVDDTDLRTIILDEKEQERYCILSDDVLLIRVNGSINNVGKLIHIENSSGWAFCDHMIKIRFDVNVVLPKFMVYFSMTDDYIKFIHKNMVSSAGQNTISQRSIALMELCIPSLPEQQVIVKILDSLFEKEEKAKELCEVLDKIDHMKKAILARAFRGELGTNNPSEESALELLKECLK